MKFSRAKIAAFFLALLLLGWMLYPRELFLAYIFEGKKELRESEAYYRKYLEKRPFNKFATLRLANLYERLGEPEKATPLLKGLMERRQGDWNVAEKYLDQLENLGDEQKLYEARLAVVRHFLSLPRFPRDRVEEQLYDAYRHALWHQDYDGAYAHLLELIRIAKRPLQYRGDLEALDWGLGKKGKIVAALKARLEENPQETDTMGSLIHIYSVTGEWDEARRLLDKWAGLFPKDGNLFELQALIDGKRGRYDRAIRALEFLLAGKSDKKLEPEDKTDLMSWMAGLYAKKGEPEKALQFYREVLRRDDTDPRNWLNVFYALGDLKRNDEAILLLEKYLEIFPGEQREEKRLAELYLYDKKDLSRMPLYSKFISEERFALDVGYLLMDAKRHSEAADWLEKALQAHPSRHLLAVTLMYAYQNQRQYEKELQAGLHFLANNPDNDDPTVWFLLSEIYYAQGRTQKGKEASQKVVNRLRGRERLSAEETRMYLQSRVHIAFRERRWEEAIPLLRQLVQERPRSWYYRTDLGYAYANAWEWEMAFAEYDRVAADADDPKPAKQAKQALRRLHEKYDSRFSAHFRHMDFGGDVLREWGAAYRQYLTEKVEIYGEGIRGHFESPSTGFTGNAQYGKLLLAGHPRRGWTFQGGVGFGTSNARSTVAPSILVGFQEETIFSLSAGYDYRTLRVDIPQGVAAGNLLNVARFNWRYNPIPRLTFSGMYAFDHNTLSGGITANEHIVEPALTYRFFDKPNFSAGYLYTYSRVIDKNGFLNIVPLVPEISASHLTTFIGDRPLDNLYLEGHAFIGGDTARHLNFFEGELWGAGARIQWGLNSWLDLETSYDYGREALVTITGQSHDVRMILSGHW